MSPIGRARQKKVQPRRQHLRRPGSVVETGAAAAALAPAGVAAPRQRRRRSCPSTAAAAAAAARWKEGADIGDFMTYRIDVFVKVGDTIKVDDALVTPRIGQGDDGRLRGGRRHWRSEGRWATRS